MSDPSLPPQPSTGAAPPYVPAVPLQPGTPPFGYPYGQAPGSVPAGYAYAQPYAQPYGQKRSGWMWAAVTAALLLLIVVVAAFALSRAAKRLTGGGDMSFGTDSVAVLDVSGVILDADKINRQLRKFGNDTNVKAIILHIDSPGGGAAASQEVYHEVLNVRHEKNKKIVASVESVGASGAYYIASACDRVYANPASVVGSIGVIMEWTNYGELLRWAKLKNVVIARGELKDAGDPSRDITPKEQVYFQSLVDNMYAQFVRDVATGRHTSPENIQRLATGQVWTGEQAQPLGLIDEQAGFRTALLETARSVGIKGEPNVVRSAKEKKGLLGLLNGDSSADDLFPNPSRLLDRAPGFYFLWK